MENEFCRVVRTMWVKHLGM